MLPAEDPSVGYILVLVCGFNLLCVIGIEYRLEGAVATSRYGGVGCSCSSEIAFPAVPAHEAFAALTLFSSGTCLVYVIRHRCRIQVVKNDDGMTR